MNWFYECRTFEQGKAKYRKLAQEHHPDRGGDLRTMQEINSQWARFKKSNRPSPGATSSPPPHSSTSNQQEPPPRPGRTRYRRTHRAVHMPASKRQAFTRTVTLIPTEIKCKTCGTTWSIDWYPGSWKPSYCDQCRADAKAAANRQRQARYRAAHKK